jgi:hypothetical protein
MSIQEKKFSYGYYLIAFLDILGQREKLYKINSLPKNSEERKQFEKLVEETLGIVKIFRKSFEDYFAPFKRPIRVPEDIEPDKRELFSELANSAKVFVPVVQAFADSIIIYVPISNESDVMQVDRVYITILSIAGSFIKLMAKGSLFRGRMEIGLAAEIDESDIYGPALAKAYKLENKVAQYSRVILGDDLINFLKEKKKEKGKDGLLAEACFKMIMKDKDRKYMIDYLGEGFMYMAKDVIPFDLLLNARSFLLKEIEEISGKHDDNLSSQYRKLEEYFNTRFPQWEKTIKSK